MTLIQGAGVAWPGPRIVTYSRPSVGEATEPVEELQCRRGGAAAQLRRATSRFGAASDGLAGSGIRSS